MPRDLRQYARQTNVRLLVGFILLLFIVGDGLVYFIWGSNAALLGVVCLLGGLMPLILIWAVLTGIDWFVHRSREELLITWDKTLGGSFGEDLKSIRHYQTSPRLFARSKNSRCASESHRALAHIG